MREKFLGTLRDSKFGSKLSFSTKIENSKFRTRLDETKTAAANRLQSAQDSVKGAFDTAQQQIDSVKEQANQLYTNTQEKYNAFQLSQSF